MKVLTYTGMGLVALWLQLTLAPLLSVGWAKPGFLLLTVLAAGLRWMDPWLFVYATVCGLALDTFSHGLLGIYGISFFVVSFAARLTGLSIYEHNLLFNAGGVFGLSLLEGAVAVTLFNALDGTVPWWAWMFERVLPTAMYNALLAPLVFYGIGRLERALKWSPTV